MTGNGIKVAVVGGSVGGLSAALQLRAVGCDVDVYERSTGAMTSKGGGIVLQDNMSEWCDGLGIDVPSMSARTDYLRYFAADGNVLINRPMRWFNASWVSIYSALHGVFGQDRYHRGHHVVDVELGDDAATLVMADGARATADLVVFADGVRSAGRQILSPETLPSYAGYVGWRGTVSERDLSPSVISDLSDAMSYYVGPCTHIVLYPIPGAQGELEVGQRLMNYVWYRNVAEGDELDRLVTDKRGRVCRLSVQAGDVQDRFIDALRADAAVQLPPSISETVVRTPNPFIQILRDIRIDRMVYGRAVILGDAAFASRPHAAAGAAKAVADGVTLGEALQATSFDIDAALANWEPVRLSVGRNLVKRVQEMGSRSQLLNTWVPGDPAFDFGLPEPDDDVLANHNRGDLHV